MTVKATGAAIARANKDHPVDRALFFMILLLVGIGLVMVLSASYYTSQIRNNSATYIFLKQVLSAFVGLIAMIFMMHFDYRKLAQPKYVFGLIGISFLFLILVLVPGIGQYINGARRWIPIPFIGLTFQPSELAKFGLILYMARTMAAHPERITSFRFGVIPYLLIAGGMFGLIMLEPNLSTASSILILCMCMLLIGGARLWHLAGLAAVAVSGIVVLIFTANYRLMRLLTFLDPFGEKAGSASLSADAYQLKQSLISFGQGGLFGMGLGNSKQKFLYLPLPDSDFIFAIVGEELGFVGAVVIMALFFVLILLGYRVAMRCRDRFGALLATGITSIIAIQVIINIAVVTGSMPTTGLPLPFFSSGGTSLAMFMGAMGVLLNISRNTQRIR